MAWRWWRRRWHGGALTIGSIRGADVRVHWTMLLVAALLSLMLWVGAVTAFVLLVLVHELGHLVLAVRSRLAVTGIEVYPWGGRCLVHMDWATPWNRAVIAWGGVLAQLVLFVVAWIGFTFAPLPGGWVGVQLAQAFVVLLPLNALMAALNLLPVAPLDGAEAWRLVPMLPGRWRAWRTAVRARRDHRDQTRATKRSITAGRAKARGLHVVRGQDDELH